MAKKTRKRVTRKRAGSKCAPPGWVAKITVTLPRPARTPEELAALTAPLNKSPKTKWLVRMLQTVQENSDNGTIQEVGCYRFCNIEEQTWYLNQCQMDEEGNPIPPCAPVEDGPCDPLDPQCQAEE